MTVENKIAKLKAHLENEKPEVAYDLLVLSPSFVLWDGVDKDEFFRECVEHLQAWRGTPDRKAQIDRQQKATAQKKREREATALAIAWEAWRDVAGERDAFIDIVQLNAPAQASLLASKPSGVDVVRWLQVQSGGRQGGNIPAGQLPSRFDFSTLEEVARLEGEASLFSSPGFTDGPKTIFEAKEAAKRFIEVAAPDWEYVYILPFGADPVLKTLRGICERLGRKYRWELADAVHFFFSGVPPLYEETKMVFVPNHDLPRLSKIVFEVDAEISGDELRRQFNLAKESLFPRDEGNPGKNQGLGRDLDLIRAFAAVANEGLSPEERADVYNAGRAEKQDLRYIAREVNAQFSRILGKEAVVFPKRPPGRPKKVPDTSPS